MKNQVFGIRVLLIVLCCAVLLGGVILGGAGSGEASATDQAAETSIDKVYSISYEDFNHVKPGPSVTAPPAEPQG